MRASSPTSSSRHACRTRTGRPPLTHSSPTPGATPSEREDIAVLAGWHALTAALENPQRRFHRLLATENAARRLREDRVSFTSGPTPVRPEHIAGIAGTTAVDPGPYAVAPPLE